MVKGQRRPEDEPISRSANVGYDLNRLMLHSNLDHFILCLKRVLCGHVDA